MASQILSRGEPTWTQNRGVLVATDPNFTFFSGFSHLDVGNSAAWSSCTGRTRVTLLRRVLEPGLGAARCKLGWVSWVRFRLKHLLEHLRESLRFLANHGCRCTGTVPARATLEGFVRIFQSAARAKLQLPLFFIKLLPWGPSIVLVMLFPDSSPPCIFRTHCIFCPCWWTSYSGGNLVSYERACTDLTYTVVCRKLRHEVSLWFAISMLLWFSREARSEV